MSVTRQYKALWPLPGGLENYLETLWEILSKIRESKLTRRELSAWVSKRFRMGRWTEGALRTCIIYMSLAVDRGGFLHLTEDGVRFLETRDKRVILNSLYRNIWGIKEMLSWLMEQPMTKEELFERFKSIGATWKRDGQVGYRLLWLRALGVVGKSGEKYILTPEGIRFVESLTAAPPPKVKEEIPEVERRRLHDEVADMIAKLGEMLGFHVKREECTDDRLHCIDVTWREFEAHLPVKVFEVEFSNVDRALSRLVDIHDIWRPQQLYLIVRDEETNRIAKRRLRRSTLVRIADKLRIVYWTDIKALYESLKQREGLIKDLAKR